VTRTYYWELIWAMDISWTN